MLRIAWPVLLCAACENIVTFERFPAPTIDRIEPTEGEPGTSVLLTGGGLLPGAIVRVGSTTGTIESGPFAGQVSFRVPEGEAGTVDVTLVNPDGQYATRPDGFTVVAVDPCLQLPGVPTSLAAVASADGITLTWAAPDGSVDGFVVDRQSGETWFELDTIAAAPTEYLDSTAEPDAIYGYRLRSYQGPCESELSSAVTVATLLPAPTSFVGSATGPASMTLTWADTYQNETGFRLDRSVADAQSFVTVASSIAAGAQDYEDTNISAATGYDYRLYAINADGMPSAAATTSVCPLLATPTQLSAEVDADHHIALSWSFDFAANVVDALVVQRSVAGSWTTLATLDAYVWDFVDTGEQHSLSGDRVYLYRLLTTRGACQSAPSDPLSVYTLPGAPTGLSAIVTGAASVALTWIDPNNLEDGYRVDRRVTGEDAYTAVAELPSDTQDHNDTALDPARSYDYRVFAVSLQGDLSTAATSTVATEPAAPTGLALSVSAPNALDLSFSDPNAGRAQLRAESTVWSVGDCPIAAPGADFAPTGYVASAYAASPSSLENLDANACYAVRTCATYAQVKACSAWAALRTTFAPQLVFDAFDLNSSCVFTASGHATFDTNSDAIYSSASTNLLLDNSTANASGITGIVPESFMGGAVINWTVEDSLGGETTLIGNSTITMARETSFNPDWSALQDGVALQGGQIWYDEMQSAWSGDNCTYCAGAPARLSLGGEIGCALASVGDEMGVRCWGQDGADADTEYDLNPMYVCTPGWQGSGCETSGQLTGVTDFSIGETHACAVLSSGQARCWGEGYLGNMVTVEDETVPVTVFDSNGTPQSGVVAAAVGDAHTCLLLDTGAVKCWGSNVTKQLGLGGATVGSFFYPADPVCAAGSHADSNCTALTDVLAIDAGVDFTCVVTADHLAKCWGYRNNTSRLGDGIQDQGSSANPVNVVREDNTALTGVRAIGTGDMFACALLDTGRVACWGYWGMLGWTLKAKELCIEVNDVTCFDALEDAVAIAVGARHICALVADGTVYCGGSGTYGELGDGTFAGTYLGSVTKVCASGSGGNCVALSDVIAVSAGRAVTCALLGSGAMKCWGYALNGLLANGTTSSTEQAPYDRSYRWPTDACLTGTNYQANSCSGFFPAMRACTRFGLEPYP